MPNIKISDLEPIALPAVGADTFFEVQTVAAGEDVSRKISLDEIVSTTGLDASFLTVSANAQLPNERVLTEGTNISFVDTGPNGTLTINASGVSFPILAPDGSVAAPSYSFASDTDSGMFLIGADILGLSAGGVEAVRFVEAAGIPQLIVPLVNAVATPTLAFGDGDTGFSQPLDDNLQVSIAGVSRFFWDVDSYNAVAGTGPAMRNAAASSTVPGFTPRRSDPDTGLGSAGGDILSLIAGGAEIAQAIEATTLQFAIAASGSSSVPELTSLADLDTGFQWNGGNETIWMGGGSDAWNFSTAKFYSSFSNGPALINTVAQNDVPTVVPDHADENTGMGSGGGDELSLIAGGVEGIRLEETAGNVFITYFGPILVPFGTGTQPGAAFDGDDDTGYFRPVADAFAVTAGGVEGTRWAEVGGSIIKTDQNDVGIIASTTQTQGQQPLLSSYNQISGVANPNDVVTAPSVSAGMRLTILNDGGNTLQVFPASGDNIGGGVDSSITIVTGATGVFLGRDGTDWDTLYNDVPTPSSGAVVPDPLLLSSGGAGVPTYSFAADSDTGVFNPVLDSLGLTAGGVEGLRITETAGAISVEIPDNLTIDATTGPGPHLSFINSAPSANIIDVLPTGSTNYNFATLRDQTGANFFFIRHDYSLSSANHRLDFSSDAHNDILRLSSSTQQVAMIQQNYFFDETSFHITATKFLEFDERNTSPVPGVGDGAFWVRDDDPNVPMFTDDAGTDFVLNESIAPGTVTDATLRWSGSAWVENILVQISVSGELLTNQLDSLGASTINVGGMDETDPGLNLEDGMSLRFEDRAQTNDFFIQNQGVGAVGPILYLDGPATGIFTIGDGLGFRIEDGGLTDWMQMFHDGTHINMGGVNTDALRIEYPILMDEQAAAAADLAGYGQFWVREDVPNTAMFTNDAGVDKSLVNDAVQARRTTDYLLTTAFVDITMDVTDVETDSAVLDHDLVTNTDNIIIGQPGTYEITVDVTAAPDAAAANRRRSLNARVRLNDAGTGIAGSVNHTDFHRDATSPFDNHLSFTFLADLIATDFITLQLSETLTGGGAGTDNANEISMKAKRLL